MKYIVLIILCLSSFACKKTVDKNSNNITTLYFIRHAEKERGNPEEENPALTDKGMERAEKWKKILVNIPFDAIYTTDYKRTKQTATPIAKSRNLAINVYPPEQLNTEGIYKKGYRNVLVVGHSNTVPILINKLLGKDVYQDIKDSNNGNLYIVTLKNKEVESVNLLTIN